MIEQNLIDKFLQDKMKRIPGFLKFFLNEPILKTTASLSFEIQKKYQADMKIFKPSVLRKIIVLPFLIMGLFILIMLLKVLFTGSLYFIIPLSLASFALFILWFAIYHSYINKKLNYRITIHHRGIIAGWKSFEWEEIQETFILIMPGGRGHQSYLVVLMADNVFHEFDLFNFGMSDGKLASYIEFYKKNSK